MRGKLIVIDGTDGSGKRTQTALLLGRLRQGRVRAEAISFPQYSKSFFGELVGRYLRGEFGLSSAVDPHMASVVFALDRWAARTRILEWLDAGAVVLADRYVSANAGHQSAKIEDPVKRREFVQWVNRMEYEVLGLPRPDVCLFLHVPWRIAQALVEQKPDRPYLEGARRDIHEADAEHLRRAEQAYVEMAQQGSEWRTIECCVEGRLLSPVEIAEAVWRQVSACVAGV